MTAVPFVLRSLLHHRFAYLGVLAGAVLGATVLLGALFAGDSIEASLRRIGENRIGRTTHVVAAGDRFFRAMLAEEFAAAASVRTAPVLYARGTANVPATRHAANQVQLVGVTDAFWSFAPSPTSIRLDPSASAVAINATLAQRLQLKAGDTLIVRLHKPGIVAGNAPVAGAEAALQSIRCTVAHVLDDASFGGFSLDTTQVAQPSIFLPIALLQDRYERPGKANLLLVESSHPEHELKPALERVVKLGDYGLTLKWLEGAAAFEIASERVFLDPEVADAITAAVPSAQPVVSYLVNEFRAGERSTPYSIGTATTPSAAPFLPPDLGPREIVINEWLAEDLQARAGDAVRLTYFQVGAGDALVEQSAEFRVRAIVPLEGLAADRAWMPDFPGISDVARPADWDPGLPLNLDRIRPKDERYWDDHRGTPKSFLPIAAGRELWSTRWGSFTALRVAMERTREAELTATLLRTLRPEMNQLLLRNVRATAEQSAQSPVDFAGLFIGMSFFLIIAALGLVALLFHFALLQRNRESALLTAVGIPPRRLLRWRIAEAMIVLIIGAAAGLGLATGYTRGILRFLGSIWAGEGSGSAFVFAASPRSIVIGVCVFLGLSLLAIWLAVRRQARRALSIRLATAAEEVGSSRPARARSLVVAAIALLAAVASVLLSGRGLPPQVAFYLAGFALLIAGIAACRAALARSDVTAPGETFSAAHLGRLNLGARRTRSVTVVGLIATAVFMVLSVASFRKHIGSDWLDRASGTGGFTFWIETTVAQNTARDGRSTGFEIFQRTSADLGEIVPLRAGVGDNANCFNLNSTTQPQLLAVDSARLAARDAFRLKLDAGSASRGWNALRAENGDAIPAFVDETTLLWALKRKVGDVLDYTDENGQAFRVRIAGTLPDSLFQGYLIVDEQAFLARFPSHPGYSLFLVDAKSATGLDDLRKRIESALVDAGGRADLTRDILAAFHQIENTYIAIFNVLGTLGVVLGSLGLAIVVARNLRERRGEFAVMTAMGIPRRVLGAMVFSEFGRLVLWGIGIGALTAAVAVWPNVTTFPPVPTLLLVASLLLGIVVLNLASGWMIFRWSTRDLHRTLLEATQ